MYYEDGSSIAAQSNKTTSLNETRNNDTKPTYQVYANYQNKWTDHSLNAMVGYEGYKHKWENLGASRNNYELDTYPYLNLGPEDYQYNSGSAGHNAYQSVFGRAMYSYKDRYMFKRMFVLMPLSRLLLIIAGGYSLLYRQVGLFLVNLGSLKISRLII